MVEQYKVMRNSAGQPDVSVFNTEHLKSKAIYASKLVLAGVQSGLYPNFPVKEVAAAACDLTDELFKIFREREWIIDLPTPEEIVEQLNADVRKRTEEAQKEAEKGPSGILRGITS